MDSEADIIARNIRVLRNQRKITQMQLAELSGVSTRAISTIEKGEDTPTVKILSELAAFFKVQTFELLKPMDTPSTEQQQARKTVGDMTPEELEQAIEKAIEKAIKKVTPRKESISQSVPQAEKEKMIAEATSLLASLDEGKVSVLLDTIRVYAERHGAGLNRLKSGKP